MTDVTCEQVDNARRLADGLDKVAEQWPDRFDMGFWVQLDDRFWNEPYEHGSAYDALARHERGEHPEDCHTVGCALGWGPYLLGEPLGDEAWSAYAARVLGVRTEFWWLFSPAAYPEDVTPSDVATRLRGWADAQEVTVDD